MSFSSIQINQSTVEADDIVNTPAGTVAATILQNAINELDTEKVPKTTTVNGKALSSNITLTASDVSAVPTTTTVNGNALSSNITLDYEDILKLPTTTTDDATAVIDVATTSIYTLTAVANATAFSTTGTPQDGKEIWIRFKDAGVSKALSWDAIFVPIGVTLPTATVAGKWHYIKCMYNSNTSKFDVLAVSVQA